MTNFRKLQAIRRRGFTLMETVLVIAVGIGLIIGGIVFYEQAEQSKREAELIRIITTLSAEIHQKHARNRDFSAVSVESISPTSSLPLSVLDDLVLTGRAGLNPTYTIQVPSLSRSMCRRITAQPVGARLTLTFCSSRSDGTYAAIFRFGP